LNSVIGFAASLLAVWCQILLLASISLAPSAMAADPLGDIPICHTDDGTQPVKQKPGEPGHNCTLCALCLSNVSPLAILSPPPTLFALQSVAIVQPAEAIPQAPPVVVVFAAQPRGPPG
jgi:Protein of unknown function (DUF2946)